MSGKPHVTRFTGKDGWYTPPRYVEAARRVLGGIDLDPASSDEAQATVRAGTYYTVDDDGLARPWPSGARVWMNPPYGAGIVGPFVKKAIAHDGPAVVLVSASTDTAWGQSILAEPGSIWCFHGGRPGISSRYRL